MNVTGQVRALSTVAPLGAQVISEKLQGRRLLRERKTMAAMLRCYCAAHHASARELCAECQALFDYATVRLERCRFGEDKPTCAKCPVHCYQARRREQVKAVMRYAGRRMLWQHPVLALRHWWDGMRASKLEFQI